MSKAALVINNVVINIIEYDPEGDYEPPSGTLMVPVADDEVVSPGYSRENNSWVAPPEAPSVDPEPSLEERLATIETEVKSMKERVKATPVTNSDAVKVRDAIAGPKETV